MQCHARGDVISNDTSILMHLSGHDPFGGSKEGVVGHQAEHIRLTVCPTCFLGEVVLISEHPLSCRLWHKLSTFIICPCRGLALRRVGRQVVTRRVDTRSLCLGLWLGHHPLSTPRIDYRVGHVVWLSLLSLRGCLSTLNGGMKGSVMGWVHTLGSTLWLALGLALVLTHRSTLLGVPLTWYLQSTLPHHVRTLMQDVLLELHVPAMNICGLVSGTCGQGLIHLVNVPA